MMPVRFLPLARTQLREIYLHIASENEYAARAVVARVEAIANLLAHNPGMGRVVSRRGVKMFPVKPYPYLIYYRNERGLQILRVVHGARRQPRFHEPAPPFAR